MENDQPQQLSVLLEHDAGVMEVFFTVFREGRHVAFRPIGSVPRSGSIRATDREKLVEALHLLKWSKDHAAVFDGEVVKSTI